MELSRTAKIILGILTAWPPVYIALFILFMFAMIGLGGGGELPPEFAAGFAFVMIVHAATIFLSIGLMVFYIIHAVKDARLKSDMRVIWIILIVMGGMLAHPVYWYLQIWRTQSETAASPGQIQAPPAGAWMEPEARSESFSDRRSG